MALRIIHTLAVLATFTYVANASGGVESPKDDGWVDLGTSHQSQELAGIVKPRVDTHNAKDDDWVVEDSAESPQELTDVAKPINDPDFCVSGGVNVEIRDDHFKRPHKTADGLDYVEVSKKDIDSLGTVTTMSDMKPRVGDQQLEKMEKNYKCPGEQVWPEDITGWYIKRYYLWMSHNRGLAGRISKAMRCGGYGPDMSHHSVILELGNDHEDAQEEEPLLVKIDISRTGYFETCLKDKSLKPRHEYGPVCSAKKTDGNYVSLEYYDKYFRQLSPIDHLRVNYPGEGKNTWTCHDFAHHLLLFLDKATDPERHARNSCENLLTRFFKQTVLRPKTVILEAAGMNKRKGAN